MFDVRYDAIGSVKNVFSLTIACNNIKKQENCCVDSLFVCAFGKYFMNKPKSVQCR